MQTEKCGLAGELILGGKRYGVVPAGGRVMEAECGRVEVDGEIFAVLPAGEALASLLTARELQVAVLVAQGHATKNIAYRMQISEWTVGTYLRRIFAKLDVDSRAAMVFRCAPLIAASLQG